MAAFTRDKSAKVKNAAISALIKVCVVNFASAHSFIELEGVFSYSRVYWWPPSLKDHHFSRKCLVIELRNHSFIERLYHCITCEVAYFVP